MSLKTTIICFKIKNPPTVHLPRKYNRQRRRLLFLVSASVRKKWGYERKLLDSRFGCSSSCFYSHYIISLKKYDMVSTTFLYIIIILCYVNKLNSSMSNFGGRFSQPKKSKPLLGISFFCQHNSTGGGFLILKQILVTTLRILQVGTTETIVYFAKLTHVFRQRCHVKF
jgi:hypothetical protein